RIWRVNIDDGRLRARALERYLAVSRLPRNPRWRDVLRSAYFVLGKCDGLSADARAELQARIDTVLAYTRRDALV
ncbi:tetratricopeptide repeat protein, partial [Salinisphaera sp. USBA-960]|nr:tetratricopeptide repeat protein [Salifodinibacter halophilus]